MAEPRRESWWKVFQKGPSWYCRWSEPVQSADGRVRRPTFTQVLAPATGDRAVTYADAERIAWEDILGKIPAAGRCPAKLQPGGVSTVEEFIAVEFVPHHVATLKPAGQRHYRYQLKRVREAIGQVRMRDVGTSHVMDHLAKMRSDQYSAQCQQHFRNVVRTIFSHSRLIGYTHGDNPTTGIRITGAQRKERNALSAAQCRDLLSRLESPAREVALVSISTSMNVAELAALRWKWVNLADESAVVSGELVPPQCLAVRENFSAGKFGTLKTANRRRLVPLPEPVAAALRSYRATVPDGPEDLVFANKKGKPLDAGNYRNRVWKPVSELMGLPFRVSWHVFRRTYATLASEVGQPVAEAQFNLGHASGMMTLHYTRPDVERRRKGMEDIAALLQPQPKRAEER